MTPQTDTTEPISPTPAADKVTAGLLLGLAPNVVIFVALYSSDWAEDHLPDWLAVGVLYAGPVAAAVTGVVFIVRSQRRKGAGLVLAALVTVSLWYAYFALESYVVLGSNTAGG